MNEVKIKFIKGIEKCSNELSAVRQPDVALLSVSTICYCIPKVDLNTFVAQRIPLI